MTKGKKFVIDIEDDFGNVVYRLSLELLRSSTDCPSAVLEQKAQNITALHYEPLFTDFLQMYGWPKHVAERAEEKLREAIEVDSREIVKIVHLTADKNREREAYYIYFRLACILTYLNTVSIKAVYRVGNIFKEIIADSSYGM